LSVLARVHVLVERLRLTLGELSLLVALLGAGMGLALG
jgi:hypothetical protein